MLLKDTLGVKDLANYLSVSETTVYNMVKRRSIPHFRIGNKNGKILFRKQAIDKWLISIEKENMQV